MNNNTADMELALIVGPYFRLNEKSMNHILPEVKLAFSGWQKQATLPVIPKGNIWLWLLRSGLSPLISIC